MKISKSGATSESPVDKKKGSIDCPRPYLGWTGLWPLWSWFLDTTHVRAGESVCLVREGGGCGWFGLWPVNSLTSMVGASGQISGLLG